MKPLSINLFPLSFEGEGDKGGKVSKHSLILQNSLPLKGGVRVSAHRKDNGKTQNDRKGGFMVKAVKGASGLSGAGS